MKSFFLLFFISLPFASSAQTENSPQPAQKAAAKSDSSALFAKVDVLPKFPGGEAGFQRFIASNVNFSKSDKEVQGRVYFQFTVEKDGSLGQLRIARGLSPSVDAELMRVMKLSPKWEPGIQNGRAVRVAYTVPIRVGGY